MTSQITWKSNHRSTIAKYIWSESKAFHIFLGGLANDAESYSKEHAEKANHGNSAHGRVFPGSHNLPH
jgi:hypothetical protein